jgi:hypothetical protein
MIKLYGIKNKNIKLLIVHIIVIFIFSVIYFFAKAFTKEKSPIQPKNENKSKRLFQEYLYSLYDSVIIHTFSGYSNDFKIHQENKIIIFMQMMISFSLIILFAS